MEELKERIKQFWYLPISLKAFYYLLFLTIGDNFFNYIRPIINSVGLSESTDRILFIFWIVGIYFCLSLIFKTIRLIDIVGYLAICSFYYLSPTIYPHTQIFVVDTFSSFALQTIPFYFLALMIDYNRDKTAINIISKLQLIMTVLIVLLSLLRLINYTMSKDEMGQSYSILFPTMFMYYTYSGSKKVVDLLFFLLGLAMILMFGTRGPLVCLILFLLVFLFVNNRHNAVMTINLLLVLGVFYIFLRPIMIILMFFTRMIGLSTRIFEKFLEDELIDYENSSSRNEIHDILWNYISNDRGGIGYGFGSDRIVGYKNTYAHNLVYEVWMDFGLYIGSFLLILFVFFVLKAFKKVYGHDPFNLFLMLLIWSVGRLMLSSSYIQDISFYFFIGYCTNVLRSNNISEFDSNDEYYYIVSTENNKHRV